MLRRCCGADGDGLAAGGDLGNENGGRGIAEIVDGEAGVGRVDGEKAGVIRGEGDGMALAAFEMDVVLRRRICRQE